MLQLLALLLQLVVLVLQLVVVKFKCFYGCLGSAELLSHGVEISAQGYELLGLLSCLGMELPLLLMRLLKMAFKLLALVGQLLLLPLQLLALLIESLAETVVEIL